MRARLGEDQFQSHDTVCGDQGPRASALRTLSTLTPSKVSVAAIKSGWAIDAPPRDQRVSHVGMIIPLRPARPRVAFELGRRL